MRKPKTAKQKYKHAYNVGYSAGKKYTNGNPSLGAKTFEMLHPTLTPVLEVPQKPIDKWIKLLSLLKEVA